MAIDILTVEPSTPDSCKAATRAATSRFEATRVGTEESSVVTSRVEGASGTGSAATGQGRGVDAGVDPIVAMEQTSDRESEQLVSPTQADVVAVAKPSLLSDYIQLTKPRIVVMILVTTVATALIGSAGTVTLVELMWLLVGTGLVAASAGAANQVWERVIDLRMTRTARRPLPAGRRKPFPVVVYTLVLGVAGTAILYGKFSAIPAAVGLATWFLYVLVYTPMKTRTSWNTTVGAIAGAIPMLIGYTATGGSVTDMTGWLLVGILVAWQYPHFMAIAWIYRRQYAEAGFQMSTTVDPSGRSAAIQSIAGSIGLVGCAVALCWIPMGWVGAGIATLAVFASGWPMLRASLQFAYEPGDTPARRLLRKSLLVLPVVLAIVTVRLFW